MAAGFYDIATLTYLWLQRIFTPSICRQYTVDAENRIQTVDAESRIQTIDSENRTYTVDCGQ